MILGERWRVLGLLGIVGVIITAITFQFHRTEDEYDDCEGDGDLDEL